MAARAPLAPAPGYPVHSLVFLLPSPLPSPVEELLYPLIPVWLEGQQGGLKVHQGTLEPWQVGAKPAKRSSPWRQSGRWGSDPPTSPSFDPPISPSASRWQNEQGARETQPHRAREGQGERVRQTGCLTTPTSRSSLGQRLPFVPHLTHPGHGAMLSLPLSLVPLGWQHCWLNTQSLSSLLASTFGARKLSQPPCNYGWSLTYR